MCKLWPQNTGGGMNPKFGRAIARGLNVRATTEARGTQGLAWGIQSVVIQEQPLGKVHGGQDQEEKILAEGNNADSKGWTSPGRERLDSAEKSSKVGAAALHIPGVGDPKRRNSEDSHTSPDGLGHEPWDQSSWSESSVSPSAGVRGGVSGVGVAAWLNEMGKDSMVTSVLNEVDRVVEVDNQCDERGPTTSRRDEVVLVPERKPPSGEGLQRTERSMCGTVMGLCDLAAYMWNEERRPRGRQGSNETWTNRCLWRGGRDDAGRSI
ncbi:hypothetical protein B0H19DRAFT_1069205 [Mycena capillaripes]|nr:hypothetical protein B0H19DRAFT_1069205 [Mycena capillaripes]